jgi:hypothetical protein
MITLKKISQAAVPGALAKAERYRLLNEPEQAESICRDILAVDETHAAALVTLLLSLTDQFRAASTSAVRGAEEVLERVREPYMRAYYAGIIHERWALALLEGGDPGHQAFHWLESAMKHYDAAEDLATEGNDDAILRWNSCARLIAREGLHGATAVEGLDAGDGPPRR